MLRRAFPSGWWQQWLRDGRITALVVVVTGGLHKMDPADGTYKTAFLLALSALMGNAAAYQVSKKSEPDEPK